MSTLYGGDMSSRTTAIGQGDNQSFINGNIMVKGSYKYDQAKDTSPK